MDCSTHRVAQLFFCSFLSLPHVMDVDVDVDNPGRREDKEFHVQFSEAFLPLEIHPTNYFYPARMFS